MAWLSKLFGRKASSPLPETQAQPQIGQQRTIRIAIRRDNVVSHVVVAATSTLSVGDLESILERPVWRLSTDLDSKSSKNSLLAAKITLEATLKSLYPQTAIRIIDLRVETPKS